MISAFRKPEKSHQSQSNVSQALGHMTSDQNEAQFFTQRHCFNGASQNSPIIALPSGMMMHQHPITSGCSSNQQHVPRQIQQYFILNQNYAPTSSFDQNTQRFVYPVVFMHGNVHQGIQPFNLSANVLLQSEPEQDSPMNLEDDRCAAQCTNKISGHFYNLPSSNESLFELQVIQEAARALFNASKIAKEKVALINLPREKTDFDQNFDRNINSSLGLAKNDFSNNRLQSEKQDVSLHNQEKDKAESIIQDKLSLNKIQSHQKDDKQYPSIGNIRRSPSIMSTQCESQKRESPPNQQILREITSQGGSDTQSFEEEIKDMKEANHFTNRRKQGTAQKLRPSMFSQLDLTTKGRSFNRNNNYLQQTTVSRIQDGSFYLNDVMILEKILDSNNLNECVSIILNKDRTVTITQAKIEKHVVQQNQTLNFKAKHISNQLKESKTISDRQISPQKSEVLQMSTQDGTIKDCTQSKYNQGLTISLTKINSVSEGLDNISQLVLTNERQSLNQDSNCYQPEIKEEKQHQQKDYASQNYTHLSTSSSRRGPYKKGGASFIDMRVCNFKKEKDQNRSHSGSGLSRKTLKVVGQHSARTKLSNHSKESSLMINRQKSVSSSQDSVNSADNLNSRRQRQRKNDEQHNFLMNQFLKNPNWDKDTLQRLSEELGLKMSQIYKWNWDQQKKIRDTTSTSQAAHSSLSNVIQYADPNNII